MTWTEIVTHVRRAKHCKTKRARWLIGNEIQNGSLPVYDERPVPMGSSPLGVPQFTPPRDAQYWAECETHPDDPDLLREHPPYDRELVDKRRAARLDKAPRFWKPKFPRFQLLKLWPLAATSEQTPGKDIVSLPKGGRPSVRNRVYQTLAQMRSAGRSLNKLHKVLADEIASENQVELGAKGWDERTIVRHISKYLRDHSGGT
jgi:hypothetical protein